MVQNAGKPATSEASPIGMVQEPQREQLSALLDNIYNEFVATVSAARGKTEAEVGAMLDDGIYGAPLTKVEIIMSRGIVTIPSSDQLIYSTSAMRSCPDMMRQCMMVESDWQTLNWQSFT